MSDITANQPKRNRAPNYTNGERDAFIELIFNKYRHFVECKKTDAVSCKEKKQKWEELGMDFNSTCKVHFRTVTQLMDLWDN